MLPRVYTRLRWLHRDYPVTLLCVGAPIAAFVADRDAMLAWGEVGREALWAGEYWRLVSPVLAHVDAMHLAINVVLLAVVLPRLEDTLGHLGAAAVFLVSGTSGHVLSVLGSPLPSAGMSAAVFGVIAARWAEALHREGSWIGVLLDREGYLLLTGTLLLLILGIGSPSIDHLGHLGGLVAGGATGELLFNRHRPALARRILAGSLLCVLAGAMSLAMWSFWDGEYHLARARAKPTAAGRQARLETGLRYAPRHAGLNQRLYELLRESDPPTALAHRELAIAGGIHEPHAGPAAARLALAMAYSREQGDPAAAGRIAAQIDAAGLSLPQALDGLALLLEAGEMRTAQTWASTLLRRDTTGRVAPLCRALLVVEDPVLARADVDLFLATRPHGTPPALVRWLQEQFP